MYFCFRTEYIANLGCQICHTDLLKTTIGYPAIAAFATFFEGHKNTRNI